MKRSFNDDEGTHWSDIPELRQKYKGGFSKKTKFEAQPVDPRWERPAAPRINPRQDSVIFQNFSITYSLESPCDLSVIRNEQVPVINVFGVTEKGNSVQCNIHNFLPYIFVRTATFFTHQQCKFMLETLNDEMKAKVTSQGKAFTFVHSIETAEKRSIMGFREGDDFDPFLKITFISPRHVPLARTILEAGIQTDDGKITTFKTFESNIEFVLRFMVDVKMYGASWVEVLPPFDLAIGSAKKSNCQIEIDVDWRRISCKEPSGEWSKIAPFRILSFDIECAAPKGEFPQPERDPVIQIANYVQVHGQKDVLIRNVFTLGTCSPIPDAEVIDFPIAPKPQEQEKNIPEVYSTFTRVTQEEQEKKMLEAWCTFLRSADPDWITGYNFQNFDMWYLMKRAETLGLTSFAHLGRIRNRPSKIKMTTFSSKAYGSTDTKETSIEGRVQVDMLKVIQREHKLRSYTLNAVSAHFLGEQKEDVHHSAITGLFEGSADDRRRLAVYCLKDAYLPKRLMDKLAVVYNMIGMVRVTGVPLEYLLTRGQQIKVFSQMLRKAAQDQTVIPFYEKSEGGESEDGPTYEGATVLDPMSGFHDIPIATLDFASLYPSIMMAHNLCYTTLLSLEQSAKMDPSKFERTPNGDCFVTEKVKLGILPQILKGLLDERKKTRDQQKLAKDPSEYAVLEGRQLALKISANSVYGFTGATVGKLPCVAISGGVTAYGRQMIQFTKGFVEAHYTQQNGYAHDAIVIYGDTDSVMVKFGTQTVAESMELGREAAKRVTKEFPPPISLAFEKVLYPYLLINKKRYAGLYWTKPDKWDKLDMKGIESVRRDNCRLVKVVIDTCLEKLLIDKNPQLAQEYVKTVISDLVNDRVDISLLVISKSLSKKGEEYHSKMAHVELAARMAKRDPLTAPAKGDRVPYVMVKGIRGSKNFENSEDPLYVLRHNKQLDFDYYINNQLKKPITRIFEPIVTSGNCSTLFQGEHTKVVKKSVPTDGGLLAFAVSKPRCLACKHVLKEGQTTVCEQCQGEEPFLYIENMNKLRECEKLFSDTWTQCQNCQGSVHAPVLCSNRDCPIFYKREKVKNEVSKYQEIIDRFKSGEEMF